MALLLLATGLVVYAAWLAVSGVFHWAQDAGAVKEAPVTVTATEVAALPRQVQGAPAANDPFARERGWYRDFAARYRRLYASRHDRFRQPADRPLTRDAFDARFLGRGGGLRQSSG